MSDIQKILQDKLATLEQEGGNDDHDEGTDSDEQPTQ